MDKKEIRRIRLRKLIDDRFDGKAARLATALDMKAPQLHRWLSGGQGMNEDSADNICKIVGLPMGWLDTLDDLPAPAAPRENVSVVRPPTRHEQRIAEITALLEQTDLEGLAVILDRARDAARHYRRAKQTPRSSG